MEVIIKTTAREAAEFTAKIIADSLRAKPDMVLGLATGCTQEPVYDELARLHADEGLDFSVATSFNLDEYVGLDGDDPCSYRYFMNHWLFDHVNIDKARTFVPSGTAPDLYAAADEYERMMAEAGGIDLQLLGIGNDGHIGFNEPLSGFTTRTRPVMLNRITIEQNRPLFDDPARIPTRAVTMGVGTVLDARRNLLLATGEKKADVIAAMIEGPMSSMCSAGALQLHADTVVVLDEGAAGKLRHADEYRWMFSNDPRWA